MKVLFTAAGSIGSRHITNLYNLCLKSGEPLIIDVIRNSDRILPTDIKSKIRNEIRCEDNLDDQYDVVFITDETKTHYKNIIHYRDLCKHMFIEKPIFDSIDYNIDDIKPLSKDNVYYVACPIRFTNYYKQLKQLSVDHNIFSVRIIFSSYMPEWQPGRDYRKSFRCFNERGGGVDIDLLHELDYAIDIFGIPEKVVRVAGKFSNLEMDACDLASYILEYKDKLIEIHLDYFGRIRNRQSELYTDNDVIVVDFNKHNCEFKVSGIIEEYEIDNKFYQDEMEYFYNLIHSKGTLMNINTPEKAFETLKITKGLI